MSAGCISNFKPCSSEIKLNHLMLPPSPGCTLIHLNYEPWSPCSWPPAASPFPHPAHKHVCTHQDTHTHSPWSLHASTNNQAATQSARQACWSSQKGVLSVLPASFPAAGSAVPPEPPCQPTGRLPSTRCKAAPWYSFQTGAWERCHPIYLFQGGGA